MSGLKNISIAHVINPFDVSTSNEFYNIQNITIRSIEEASRFSNHFPIEHLAIIQQGSSLLLPSIFKPLKEIKRNVADKPSFSQEKQLPFIKDIFEIALNQSTANYFIFTNMDIGLMPHFYDFVHKQISDGIADSILITRRRVGLQNLFSKDLSLIYSDIGKKHPGYDTFVIKREILQQFVLDDICVGVPFLEVSILHNLIAFSKKIEVFDNHHLTFHIGMEVMPPVSPLLYKHNRNVYESHILPKIKPFLKQEKFPYADLSFWKRMLNWGLNPCYRTSLMLEMEGMRLTRKIKFLIDEVRWQILGK